MPRKPEIYTCRCRTLSDGQVFGETLILVDVDGSVRTISHKQLVSDERLRAIKATCEALIQQKMNELYPGGEGFETGNT